MDESYNQEKWIDAFELAESIFESGRIQSIYYRETDKWEDTLDTIEEHINKEPLTLLEVYSSYSTN